VINFATFSFSAVIVSFYCFQSLLNHYVRIIGEFLVFQLKHSLENEDWSSETKSSKGARSDIQLLVLRDFKKLEQQVSMVFSNATNNEQEKSMQDQRSSSLYVLTLCFFFSFFQTTNRTWSSTFRE
jgi:hypothetical protein